MSKQIRGYEMAFSVQFEEFNCASFILYTQPFPTAVILTWIHDYKKYGRNLDQIFKLVS